MRLIFFFFFKIFKILCKCQIWSKICQKMFVFLENCIWIGCDTFSLLWTEYLLSAVNVSAKCPKISTMTNRDVFPLNFSLSDQKRKVKGMSCRFQQCLGPFNLLTIEGCSEIHFGNTSAMRPIFFFKMFKISFKFQKCSKNWGKIFGLLDNCIWIGCSKVSLLRR